MEVGEWMIIDFNKPDDQNKKLFLDNISNTDLFLSFEFLSLFNSCLHYCLKDIKIKNDPLSCYFSSYTKRFEMTYNNVYITVDKDFVFTFEHLKKDNSFFLKKEGSNYLFPWHLFYKEIIRVCERNDINSRKKKLLENAKNFKIMNLHAQLEESGIYNLKQQKDYLYYICENDITKIFIKVIRTDKTLHISDEQKYHLDVRKHSTRIIYDDLTFEELKTKTLGAYMLLGVNNERVEE